MYGKEIAGLTIASVSMVIAILILTEVYDPNLESKEVIIVPLIFFSAAVFLFFGLMENNNSNKPDIILHISLMPIYIGSLFIFIGLFFYIKDKFGNKVSK
jgi:hypothetical protein